MLNHAQSINQLLKLLVCSWLECSRSTCVVGKSLMCGNLTLGQIIW